ncbi:MAG: glycosyltransferase [Patescibacteria group bacterium]
MSTNNPKILFLITKGNWGGAQRYVFDLANAFKNRGFEVMVGHGADTALAEKLNHQNIRTFALKNLGRDINLFADILGFFEILKILKRERPTVLHINSPKIGGLGALAGRLTGVKKIVYTAHGWPFNEDRNWFSKLIIKKISWLTIMLSHQTIVIGEKEKADVKNWWLIKNKITLIHNGINAPNFLTRDEARRKLMEVGNLPESIKNNFWVGMIGELHKNKGYEYAIKAIKNLNANLLIIGEGEERESLQKIIQENNLQDKVFLLGFIANAADYLPAFDTYLLSSIKEGLPYVLMEAGHAGLPVVASKVGAISDIIEDEKTGFIVKPKDIDSLTEKISLLIANQNIGKNLGENLKQKISQEFSLEQMVEETKRIYSRRKVGTPTEASGLKATHSGFTLIELLVVISIISLLASIVFTNLQEARSKARDTQRVASLIQIRNALELYHSENGKYPESYSSIGSNCSFAAAKNQRLTCFQCGDNITTGFHCIYDQTAMQNDIGKFLSLRPCDPSQPTNRPNGGCYKFNPLDTNIEKGFFYKVNPSHTEYKISMSKVVENLNHVPLNMSDPDFINSAPPPENTISLYSSSASRGWKLMCQFDPTTEICTIP